VGVRYVSSFVRIGVLQWLAVVEVLLNSVTVCTFLHITCKIKHLVTYLEYVVKITICHR
jgi:hypothetical protein